MAACCEKVIMKFAVSPFVLAFCLKSESVLIWSYLLRCQKGLLILCEQNRSEELFLDTISFNALLK